MIDRTKYGVFSDFSFDDPMPPSPPVSDAAWVAARSSRATVDDGFLDGDEIVADTLYFV